MVKTMNEPPQTFEAITKMIFQHLLDHDGSTEATRTFLKLLLDDPDDRLNPAIGMSNRQAMMRMTGQHIPTKEQVWDQWCAANDIETEYNESKGTWILKFNQKGRKKWLPKKSM